MAATKVAITLEQSLLRRIDRLVKITRVTPEVLSQVIEGLNEIIP